MPSITHAVGGEDSGATRLAVAVQVGGSFAAFDALGFGWFVGVSGDTSEFLVFSLESVGCVSEFSFCCGGVERWDGDGSATASARVGWGGVVSVSHVTQGGEFFEE